MVTSLSTLSVRTRRQWREWLAKHHASSPGIWLVFEKAHTGRPSVPYEDAVCEALCFGWIDSLIKRLDEDRYLRKFTPRKPGSAWSASNRRRWKALKEAGLLTPAAGDGPAGAPLAAPPPIPDLPDDLGPALRRHARAWQFFQSLAPSQRRHFVGWVHLAKRPETRERRLREAIRLLAAGRTLGLK